MVVGAGQAAEPRVLRAVAVLQIPHGIGDGDRAALFHHLLGGRAQPREPVLGDGLLDQQVAGLEIGLALGLAQHLGRDGADFVWRHGVPAL